MDKCCKNCKYCCKDWGSYYCDIVYNNWVEDKATLGELYKNLTDCCDKYEPIKENYGKKR